MSKDDSLLILYVNYGCEREIVASIKTIQPPDAWDVRVSICDNSGDFAAEINNERIAVSIVKPGKNLGYFGGAEAALDAAGGPSGRRFVILSNPDIAFDIAFFENLEFGHLDHDVGVLAPSVQSSLDGKHLNPFKFSRPDRSFFDLRIKAQRNALTQMLWQAAYNAKRYLKTARGKQPHEAEVKGPIYAAHGSLMIMTPAYFEAGHSFAVDSFLYGEELFVAEFCFSSKLQIVMRPDLEATHFEHSTTALLSSANKRAYMTASLTAVREQFF